METFDTMMFQLIAAVGELRVAAVCLHGDDPGIVAARRHLAAAEERVINAYAAASEAAKDARAA